MTNHKSVLYAFMLALWVSANIASAQSISNNSSRPVTTNIAPAPAPVPAPSVITPLPSLATFTPNITSNHSDQKTLPRSVVDAMATREERHHHFLWHNIRDNWNRLTPEAQKQITALGWAPPHPSRNYDAKGNPIAITDNFSGEDFLYMHRQMIKKVNKILADNKEPYGKVKGWTKLPGPGDLDWPVPENYSIPDYPARSSSVNRQKTAEFYNNTIRPMEINLTSPARLRNMTLGELGARIEVTLHGWYHLRYSGFSAVGYRPTVVTGLPEIDKKWDDPSYNWLVDSYSSHVHPVFWKLHGWVDARIDAWARANNLTSIKFKGTWEGGPMSKVSYMWNKKEAAGSLRGSRQQDSEMAAGMSEGQDDIMQELTKILANEVPEVSFADPVFWESPLKAAKKPKRSLCRRRRF